MAKENKWLKLADFIKLPCKLTEFSQNVLYICRILISFFKENVILSVIKHNKKMKRQFFNKIYDNKNPFCVKSLKFAEFLIEFAEFCEIIAQKPLVNFGITVFSSMIRQNKNKNF